MLIQDSIDELLLSLDIRQIDRSHIWPVLRTLAQSCERWQMVSDTTTFSPTPASSRNTLTKTSGEKEGVPSHVTDIASHVTNDDDHDDVTSHVTPEAVEEFFLQYHREKQQREEERLGDLSEPELNQSEGEANVHEAGEKEEDPYNQRKELSPLSRTAVELMQRCGHHMSAEVPTLRLMVLETLTHCIHALKHEQVS